MEKEHFISLVSAAQSGDRNALNALIAESYNELYYHAYRISKDENHAEDITQDAVMEIMDKLNKLTQPAAFSAWARQIVTHTAMRYIRQQASYIPLPEDDVLENIVEDNTSSNPYEALDQAEFSDTILSFLNKLPGEQRNAVMQFYFEDMSIGQIAQAQGVSEATVKSRLNYAKKALRASVQEYETKNEMDLYGNSREKLYDIHICYAYKDLALAKALASQLRKASLSVSLDVSESTADSQSGDNNKAISRSRVFLPLITKNSVGSPAYRSELQHAISLANDRSKEILVVCYAPDALEQFSSLLQQLARYPILTPTSTDDDSTDELCRQISSIIRGKKLDNVLFEKLSEYISAGLNDRATEILCQLIQQLCVHIQIAKAEAKAESYLTLISYLEKMTKLYTYNYNENSSALAHKKLDVLGSVSSLLRTEDFKGDDLYYVSIAIRLIYLDRVNRLDCADAITRGDVSQGIVKTLPEQEYAEKQKEYVAKYHKLMASIDSCPEASRQFILTTEQYIYSKLEKDAVTRPAPTQSSPEDELLQAVAGFTREGNKLFDLISEKQPAKDFLQCLITSYERLKSYCEVVGALEICAECIDRISELKNTLIETGDDAKATEKSESGIKTLLGLTIPKSGKYDVFISHKSEDYDIALEVYEFLRKNLKAPFLDKLSLPEMSKAEYSKAINQSLDGSRHFVAVLSDLSYMESHWVSYEMDSFSNEIMEGRKPGGNFLFVVTNDVYDQIMASNKSVLPYAFRRYEIIRLADYKNVLLNYLNT